MVKTRFILVLCLVLPVLPAVSQEPESPGAQAAVATQSSQPGAAESLKTFPKLVTQENYRALGFQSPDEASRASLGAAIPMFWIDLNDLKKFDANADPKPLLKGPMAVLYPVLVDQQVRSSLTLQPSGGSWKTTMFGRATLAKQFAHWRDEQIRSSGLQASSFFGVRIPALNLFFLGHVVNQKVLMTPVVDEPSLGLKAGDTIPAEKLLLQLVPVAKAHNDLPT